ncbi:MAG: DNA polymerase III subunit delta' [Nitrospirota bacterium]
MAFKDIIGQDRAVNILRRTIQRERIPSSYLFAGESGIGKKFTAVNLAKTLNCQNPPSPPFRKGGLGGFEIDCCDECSSCKKIDAGVHPDFLLIAPEGGQIRIEEIRAIDDILSFKPFEGRKKIVIIDEADTMNPYAANAFLKTLEEPPKDSLIILISSNPDRLPDTIRSRCSRVNFTPLSKEACGKVIKTVSSQQSTKQYPRLSTLVRLSMGRPGLAISEDLIEERAWFIKLLQGVLNAEKDGWTSKEEMERWFDLILILLRDMAIIKITQDETNLINIDLKDYIEELSKSVDLRDIIENYQKLNTLRGYLNFNLNRSLTWNYTGAILRKTMEAFVKDSPLRSQRLH